MTSLPEPQRGPEGLWREGHLRHKVRPDQEETGLWGLDREARGPFPRAGRGVLGVAAASLLSPPQNNGGCSPYAVCKSTGDGQRTCTCDAVRTVGDGFTCRARVSLVMMPGGTRPNPGSAPRGPKPWYWLLLLTPDSTWA